MENIILGSFIICYNQISWNKISMSILSFLKENKANIFHYHIIPCWDRGDALCIVLLFPRPKAKHIDNSIKKILKFIEVNPSPEIEKKNKYNPFFLNLPNNSILYTPTIGLYKQDSAIEQRLNFVLYEERINIFLEDLSNDFLTFMTKDPFLLQNGKNSFYALAYIIQIKRFNNNFTYCINFLLDKLIKTNKETVLNILKNNYSKIENDLRIYLKNISIRPEISKFFSQKMTNQDIVQTVQFITKIWGLTDKEMASTLFYSLNIISNS